MRCQALSLPSLPSSTTGAVVEVNGEVEEETVEVEDEVKTVEEEVTEEMGQEMVQEMGQDRAKGITPDTRPRDTLISLHLNPVSGIGHTESLLIFVWSPRPVPGRTFGYQNLQHKPEGQASSAQ